MSLVGSFVGGLGKKKDDKDASAAGEEKKGSEEAKDGKGGEDSKSRYLKLFQKLTSLTLFLLI